MLVVALLASVAEADTDASSLVRSDLERFVRDRVSHDDVRIDVPDLTGFTLDENRFPGTLRTEFSTRAKEPLQGRVPVAVSLYAGDELVKRAVVTPYVRIAEMVVVPVRTLRAGTTLSAEDLVTVERDAARTPNDAVRDLDFAVGMRAKRSLRKEEAIRASSIEGLPIVERGDRVQIILSSGPLVIQSAGKAQEAGSLGEWIRVLNIDSKRELSGRVDREGRVHVAF